MRGGTAPLLEDLDGDTPTVDRSAGVSSLSGSLPGQNARFCPRPTEKHAGTSHKCDDLAFLLFAHVAHPSRRRRGCEIGTDPFTSSLCLKASLYITFPYNLHPTSYKSVTQIPRIGLQRPWIGVCRSVWSRRATNRRTILVSEHRASVSDAEVSDSPKTTPRVQNAGTVFGEVER